ncbi:MAG: hypothetical protein DI527_00565 [Chelatococcus sp.]|nr:MAG: hypothetical protein DI527_00565 [Chelatococcus sp.]
MKPGRIPCCIPFCRRTASKEKFPDCEEIICGKHWRMADKKARSFKTKAEQELRRWEARCEAIEAEGFECAKANGGVHTGIIERFRVAADARQKAWKRAVRAWERCKRQATEVAMGIA